MGCSAAQHAELLWLSGELSKAFALLDEAREEADGLNDATAGYMASSIGGSCRWALWDPLDAQRWYSHEMEKPRLAQAVAWRQIFFQLLGAAHVFAGELKEAEALLTQAPYKLLEGLVEFYRGRWEAVGTMRGGNRAIIKGRKPSLCLDLRGVAGVAVPQTRPERTSGKGPSGRPPRPVRWSQPALGDADPS